MKLSVIVPVLNEADHIRAFLEGLQGLRDAGHEVIVVDGGSIDATPDLAAPLADLTLTSTPGRAVQMNAGASRAAGDVLLFLHADTELPPGAAEAIASGRARQGRRWGRFDVRLSGAHALLRIVEVLMNWRSRLSGIATGDQAIFADKSLFSQAGGFPPIALMEDIALSARLKASGRPLCLRLRVRTSSRRWENSGIVRTILLMWRLRLAYWLGTDPERLAEIYYRSELKA